MYAWEKSFFDAGTLCNPGPFGEPRPVNRKTGEDDEIVHPARCSWQIKPSIWRGLWLHTPHEGRLINHSIILYNIVHVYHNLYIILIYIFYCIPSLHKANRTAIFGLSLSLTYHWPSELVSSLSIWAASFWNKVMSEKCSVVTHVNMGL